MNTTQATTGSDRGDGFHHRTIDVGEVALHVVEARPSGSHEDAPLVVLLHGFPEYWGSWRHQLPALAKAGAWAVAPDLRGYNESDKPTGVAAYEVEKLADDIAGLIRALGRKEAVVVGHDWGAVVAWTFAERHPDMLVKLAILNVPHPRKMLANLWWPDQLLKSWYIFFFQLPRVPERLLSAGNCFAVRRVLREDGIAPDQIPGYVDAFSTPDTATSAVNYYRAAIRRIFKGNLPKPRRIEKPVLVIWGDRDRALHRRLADPPKKYVPNARVVHIPEATHWVQNVAPDQVNELLVDFIASSASRPS